LLQGISKEFGICIREDWTDAVESSGPIRLSGKIPKKKRGRKKEEKRRDIISVASPGTIKYRDVK
jgi:hypothetical protein